MYNIKKIRSLINSLQNKIIKKAMHLSSLKYENIK